MPLVRCPLSVISVAAFALPAVMAAPQSQEQSPPQSPPIRVSVDRVNVSVIVTGARGQFVEGLRREDFHILDNGIEQPLTDFAAIEEPAQLLLLVETGPAVYLLQSGHLQAAYALLNGLSPDDRVAIARYAEAPQLVSGFTADKRATSSALEQLRFNLGFGQLNLASSLAAALDWLAHFPGKKSLVLLSTGVDTSPPGVSEALLSRLKTTDVRIFAVSLSGQWSNSNPASKKPSNKNRVTSAQTEAAAAEFSQAAELLKALSSATGGRAYFPATTKEFGDVYAEIAQLVRHEYSLAFAPPAQDGKIHALQIRVDTPLAPAPGSPLPAYHLDHRQAYQAPPPQ